MIKKILLATTAMLAISGTVQAMDSSDDTVEATSDDWISRLEPVAPYDWSGAYIGLQGGKGWGQVEVDHGVSADGDVLDLYPEDFDYLIGDFARSGLIGGLHAGYLTQQDNLVYGIEGDIEYSGMKGSVGVNYVVDPDEVPFGPDEVPFGTVNSRINWLGSLRLRGGVAMDRLLIYATGGLAVGGTETAFTSAVNDSWITGSPESATKFGWTVGVGTEYAVTDAMSMRLEYRYTDLGNSNFTATEDDVVTTGTVGNNFHAVKAGLSWHF